MMMAMLWYLYMLIHQVASIQAPCFKVWNGKNQHCL